MIAEGAAGRFVTKLIGQAVARFTGLGSQAVDQVAPVGFEGTRSGRRFSLGVSAAITGIAPVQALPTTAAQWLIWNADPNRAYALEEIGMYLTSGTPGVGGILMVALVQAPANIGNSAAGIAISSDSNGGLATKCIVKSGIAITQPAAPNWVPIANNPSPNVTAFAGSVQMEHRALAGRKVIPPGQGLAIAVVAPAGTTPLYAPFASWMEIDADLE